MFVVRWILIFLCFFLFFFLVCAYIGFVCTIVRKSNGSKMVQNIIRKKMGNKKPPVEEAFYRLQQVGLEDVFMKSGKVTLHAYWCEAKVSSNKAVLLAHGYRSSAVSRAISAEFYRNNGYHVLLIESRAHGKSGGRYIGLGAFEQYDILEWVKFLEETKQIEQIVLDGVSMGGASVLLSAAQNASNSIKAVIADSAYANLPELMKKNLKKLHIPIFPFYSLSKFCCKVIAGYCWDAVSPVDVAKSITVPVLLIHGEKDDFVPLYMAEEIFRACQGEKQNLIVKDAEHANARFIEPNLCKKTILGFLNNYIA